MNADWSVFCATCGELLVLGATRAEALEFLSVHDYHGEEDSEGHAFATFCRFPAECGEID